MIDTSPGLALLVSDFLVGDVAFEDLDAAIARIGDEPPDDDPALMALWGALELLLAEHSGGVLPEAELRAELSALVPMTVSIGPRRRVRAVTTSGSRSITEAIRGLVLGSPSPAAGTQVSAARA